MAENLMKIADLGRVSFGQSVGPIRASVSIKSIRHDNSAHVYFYMDLRDESGQIAAVAYNEACDKFINVIEENKTYIFHGFTVQTSQKQFTSIDHPKEIVLGQESVIQYVGDARAVNWILSPLLAVNTGKPNDMFNVIGLVRDVSDTKNIEHMNKRVRTVRLCDEYRRVITLSVWNEETYIFEDPDWENYPVVLVIDARPYDGGLTTSRYIKLLDENDPRAVSLRNAFINNDG